MSLPQIIWALSGVTTVHNVAQITGAGARGFYCYLPEGSSANALLLEIADKKLVRELQYKITRGGC